MAAANVLKWGIASCGLISHDFCNALHIAGHKIVAVAARDDDRAEKFARIHHIDKHYGGYEQLAKDPNVDVIYVGSIHPTHYDIAKLMLSHDKHVLCEKPMTMSHKHTAELIELAKQRKRFLMEGYWSRCTPVYHQVREELERASLGKVHALHATFCVPINTKDRMIRKELGASMLYDTGVYLLQLANLVFSGQEPCDKTFSAHKIHTGVDDYMSIVLQYSGGEQVAHMICDSRYEGRNEAIIYGEKGTITIGAPFWTPVSVSIDTPRPGTRSCIKQLRFDLPKMSPADAGATQDLPKMHHVNSENFVHEIMHVGQCISQGLTESDLVPHADSLHIARLLDEACAATGLT